MENPLLAKVDSDLKILSYQCDELLNGKLSPGKYTRFCKEYYYFLRVLMNLNFKNHSIKQTINSFPKLEIPAYSKSLLFLFLLFLTIGLFTQSLLFMMFFILLPLGFLFFMNTYSVVRNNKIKLHQVILVAAELRTQLYLNKSY